MLPKSVGRNAAPSGRKYPKNLPFRGGYKGGKDAAIMRRLRRFVGPNARTGYMRLK